MKVHDKTVTIWDGRWNAPVDSEMRISLCTTCMNRLEDLAQTLPRNIADNENYGNLEFVLLDYNSTDGLPQWVEAHLSKHIESGLLVYARAVEPGYFRMAHSRNLAFKIATGRIVCNVDADNWTGKEFASTLNKLAHQRPQRAIFAKGKQLIRGRLGFYKDEWENLLGGYDEEFVGYGHDDMDLMHRALYGGWMLMPFGGRFVERIGTSRERRRLNLEVPHIRATELANRALSAANLAAGRIRANHSKEWGRGTVIVNFLEERTL